MDPTLIYPYHPNLIFILPVNLLFSLLILSTLLKLIFLNNYLKFKFYYSHKKNTNMKLKYKEISTQGSFHKMKHW